MARCYFCRQPVEVERQERSNACRRCSEARHAPARPARADRSLDRMLRDWRDEQRAIERAARAEVMAAKGRHYFRVQHGRDAFSR